MYAIFNPYNPFLFAAYSTDLTKLEIVYKNLIDDEVKLDNNPDFIFIIKLPENQIIHPDLKWAQKHKIN